VLSIIKVRKLHNYNISDTLLNNTLSMFMFAMILHGLMGSFIYYSTYLWSFWYVLLTMYFISSARLEIATVQEYSIEEPTAYLDCNFTSN